MSQDIRQVPCPGCGAMQPEGSRFCDNCGSAMPVLPVVPVCTGCGTPLKGNERFCGVCGSAVDPVPPPVAEPVVVAEKPRPVQEPVSPPPPVRPRRRKSRAGLVIALLILLPLVLVIAVVILVAILLPKGPESVSLSLEQAQLERGQTLELQHELAPNLLFNKDVQWESSDESVATVENGVVTAVGEGICSVTVTTSNGKTDSCTVTVSGIAVETLEFTYKDVTLKQGQTVQFQYTVHPANADYVLTWSSDNMDVVSVSASGEVRAEGLGSCEVRVSAQNGVSASCVVRVVAAEEAKTVMGSWSLVRIEERYNDSSRKASGSSLVLAEDLTGTGKLDGQTVSFRWYFAEVDTEGDYWFVLDLGNEEFLDVYYSVFSDELCIYGEDESLFFKRK